MRRLIIINSILTFLLLIVFILGYYLLEYPDDFDISRYIRDAEWKPFALTVFGLVIAAIALSFLPLTKYNQKRKATIFFAALQGLFLSLFVFKMLANYKQNKKEFDDLLSQYKEKAAADVKSGFIEIEYAGGLELADEREQKMGDEIDSVRRTYGLSYRNSGCIVSAALIKAQEEYERLTKSYLDKRNGPGWEERMNGQIEAIRTSYR